MPGLPRFVRGTAIVRGRPIPVVDLRDLLGDDMESPPARLVTVRTGTDRRVGLLVDEVRGLWPARTLEFEALAPLMSDAAAGVVAELARLDDQLLVLLRAGALLPDEAWARLSPEAT
jgi:purine-binding chemotaxis protein CheW